jgi:adenylate cyclase
MNRERQIRIKQLQVIIIAWMLTGLIIAVYDHLVLFTNNSAGPSAEYSFVVSLAINMGSGLIGALMGGSFLVFFVNVRYRDRPYGLTIIAVILAFITVIAIIAALIALISGPIVTGKEFLPTIARMMPRTLKALIVWSMVVAITQLLLQVNSKFGQGIFSECNKG